MARGKQTPPEQVYKVMLSYIQTHNFSETARLLDMPITTVEKVVKDNREKPEFVRLCNEKKDEFIETASRLIDKLQIRMEEALDDRTEKIPLSQLSTTYGTLYDKRALAKGESTNNTTFKVEIEVVE